MACKYITAVIYTLIKQIIDLSISLLFSLDPEILEIVKDGFDAITKHAGHSNNAYSID